MSFYGRFMKFAEELAYSISNPAIKEADELRQEVNGLVALVQTQNFLDNNQGISNLETPRRIAEAIKKTRRVLGRKDRREITQFDSLVLRDITTNLRIAEAYNEYCHDPETTVRTSALFSTIFGRGASKILIEGVTPKNYPHKDIHEHAAFMAGFFSDRIDAEDIFGNHISNPKLLEIRAEFKEILDKYRTEIEKFYRTQGVVDNIHPVKFEFSPTNYMFSYWAGHKLNTAHIDPQRIYCGIPRGSTNLEIQDSSVALLGAHEVAHGLLEELSQRTMPTGLSPTNENYVTFIHGTSNEGAALRMEKFFLDWAKKSGAIKLNPTQLKMMELLERTYLPRKLPQLVYDVLKKKEDEADANPNTPSSFNKRAQLEIAKITGIRENMFTDRFFDRSITETLQQATYVFGAMRVEDLVQEAEKRGHTRRQISLGLFKGDWTDYTAQKKFLFDIYLPELQRRGIK